MKNNNEIRFHRSFENLLGKVKTLISVNFNVIDKFERIKKGDITYKEIMIFNENGYLIEKMWGLIEKRDGSFGHCTYSYDNKENMIDLKSYNSDGSLKYQDTYMYDYKGNMIEENQSFGRVKTTYKYNDNGDKIEGECFSNGFMKFTWKFYYDDKCNLIEEYICIPFPKTDRKNIYKYDSNGKMIEAIHYKYDGDLDFKETSKWCNKGNLIERNINYSDGSSKKNTYKYDDKGRKIEENSFSTNGNIETRKFYDKGNEIESNHYNSDGSLDYKNTYKYDYDATGNWIKIIIFENGIAKIIVEREIEYY